MAGGRIQVYDSKSGKFMDYPVSKKKTNTQRIKDLESEFRTQEIDTKFNYLNEQTMSSNITNLNFVGLINAITQGPAQDQCDGLSVQHKSLGFRYLFHNKLTTPAVVRVFVIKTSQGHTLDTTGSQLLKSSDGTGRDFNASNEQQQFYLRANPGRYTIIYDKLIKLSGVGVDNGCNKIISFNKNYKNTKRTFNASGTPNDKFYIAMKVLDPAMDANASVEVSGSAYFSYKDN